MNSFGMQFASDVCDFLLECRKIDRARFDEADKKQDMPFGDLAYGQALTHWNKAGRPKNAWFSWAPGQIECAHLMAFKKELTAKFGLEILTIEEGEARRKKELKVITTKVDDWGVN